MTDKLREYFNNDDFPAGVWAGKYQVKNESGVAQEETPDDMHRRMAKEFARIDFKQRKSFNLENLSDYGKKLEIQFASFTEAQLEEYFYYYMKDFKYIIPQGSIMSMLGNTYKTGSLSNCFVVPAPYDSYGGIMRTDEQMAQLMKRRGGVGTNLNTLRFAKSRVSNAAESSTGAPSFASRYSNTTREVAQDGRRGALMLMLSCLHPDIFNWVTMKDDRTKVTGANISVMLTDKFMKAAEAEKDFICRFPVDRELSQSETNLILNSFPYNEIKKVNEGKGFEFYAMKIKARELFDLIIEMAWKNAEPGLAFMDAIHNFSPDGVYEMFKAIASNPCGEQWLNAFDSCRLMALNFFSVVKNPFTKDAEIDWNTLYEISYLQQRLADNLVELEMEYVQRIIAKIKSDPEPEEIKAVELDLWENVYKTAKAGRRTGCGFTALGDMVAALGLKYDSDEGIAAMEKVAKIKMEAELDCSIDLAILRGIFEGWNKDLEFLSSKSVKGLALDGKNNFYNMLCEEFPKQSEKIYQFGRRNVSWSTVAPTGSLSIITKLINNFNASAGIEPQFALWYFRNKKINPNDKNTRVDFVDQNGDSWQQFPIVMGAFKDWYEVNKHIIFPDEIVNGHEYMEIEEMSPSDIKMIFELSPWFGSTANDINWVKRVEIQSRIQRYTTNAISSTVNLPETVKKEEVAEIYWAAWKAGLKGITVYRDGSRTGVLVNKAVTAENFDQNQAPKRPESLEASIFHLKVKGNDYTVAVGELNEKPYEIFATEGVALKGCDKGTISKKGKGKYHFICKDVDEAITENMTDEQAALTRMLSTALRHGADVRFIVEQLNKTNGDMTSFSKAMARTLKRYIPDDTKIKGKCQDCGSENLVYREGCKSCLECGSSACGG